MDHDFGKRLEKARIERGLSIEQAAASVRIRGPFLRALENGDLTKFPNAAYSKSFLLMYGRFLGVDVKSVAAEIDTTTQMKVEGYQYLTSRASGLPKAKPEPEPGFSMAPTPRSSGSWLPLLVLGGLAAVIVAAFILWSNVNRLGDSRPEAPRPVAMQTDDESAVQPLAHTATPRATPVTATQEGPRTGQLPKPKRGPESPTPTFVISPPKPLVAADAAPIESPSPDLEIPKARPISPVARIASTDAAALADFTDAKPRTPPLTDAAPARVIPATHAEEENDARTEDPDAIILEPRRKTWVVIRSGPGTQPLYEDYLYPTAKPLRLPAGRYFIELKDADAVEISRNGRRIAYTAPGVVIQ